VRDAQFRSDLAHALSQDRLFWISARIAVLKQFSATVLDWGEISMSPLHFLRSTHAGVTLAVRAQPGAKKTAILGVYGEGDTAQLKIAVQAPPIEGRANEALIAFLSKTFDLPKSSVELVSGEFSRSKVFLLRGITKEQVHGKLAPPLRPD
jgi:hypothetical protein